MEANILNASVTGFRAGASVSATGASANILNASLTKIKVGAHASASLAEVNAFNFSATGVSAEIGASFTAFNVNAFNVSVSGINIGFKLSASFDLDYGNVSLGLPGGGIHIPLNPLSWFLNIGLGGGGKSGEKGKNK